MNEERPTRVVDETALPSAQIHPSVEDPKAQRKQRINDAFTIGSFQSRPMDIEFFNRTKR
jgi:hypothetical protein